MTKIGLIYSDDFRTEYFKMNDSTNQLNVLTNKYSNNFLIEISLIYSDNFRTG